MSDSLRRSGCRLSAAVGSTLAFVLQRSILRAPPPGNRYQQAKDPDYTNPALTAASSCLSDVVLWVEGSATIPEGTFCFDAYLVQPQLSVVHEGKAG